MKRHRFTRAELIAEFLRIGGSGRAEEQVMIPVIRRKLSRSLREYRRGLWAAKQHHSYRPDVDLKKRQANDLD